MYCKVCGGQTRQTHGVHYIDGKWLMLKADYCHKHGSFVDQAALRDGIEVTPDPTRREHIRPGIHCTDLPEGRSGSSKTHRRLCQEYPDKVPHTSARYQGSAYRRTDRTRTENISLMV